MQRAVRALAAVLLLVGGAIHLDLWRRGYQGIPFIGPLFLANVVASLVVAAAVLVRGGRLTLAAGAALGVGSLAALVLSRTVGLLGFIEPAWTVDAMRTVAAEVAALMALAVVAVARQRADLGLLRPAPASVAPRRR